MRLRLKMLAAGAFVSFMMIVPFAQAAHATAYVTRATCEAGGGNAGTVFCIGGDYNGATLLD